MQTHSLKTCMYISQGVWNHYKSQRCNKQIETGIGTNPGPAKGTKICINNLSYPLWNILHQNSSWWNLEHIPHTNLPRPPNFIHFKNKDPCSCLPKRKEIGLANVTFHTLILNDHHFGFYQRNVNNKSGTMTNKHSVSCSTERVSLQLSLPSHGLLLLVSRINGWL